MMESLQQVFLKLPDGFGFIRNANYLSDPHDVYVFNHKFINLN